MLKINLDNGLKNTSYIRSSLLAAIGGASYAWELADRTSLHHTGMASPGVWWC
jgi:hypothetical protein